MENLEAELNVTYHNTAELIPDPENARSHDRRNIDAIKESIQRFGIRKPIVVHEASKIIYAGNGVYTAAIELGLPEIPVAWIPEDVPAEVAKAFAIYDNRTTELSDWNPEKLQEMLDDLPDLDVDDLWDIDELDELLSELPDFTPISEDEQPALDELDEFIDLTFRIPRDVRPIIDSEIDRIVDISNFQTDNKQIQRGLALERMATLSAQTPIESLK